MHRALLLRRLLPSVLALGAVLAAPTSAQGADGSELVTHIRIDDALDVGYQALLRRAIDHARGAGEVLVVELDTPGGEVTLMWRMANAILDASADGVRTVAWVNDHALSAGALLALACDELYMSQHATIGSATPVTIGPGGLGPVSQDPDVKEKNYSALRKDFSGIAERKGRPGVLAEAMVDRRVEVFLVSVDGERRLVGRTEFEDLQRTDVALERLRTVVDGETLLNLSGTEAVELQVANGVRDTFDDLIAKLGHAPDQVLTLAPSGSEKLAGILYMLGPLLLVAGLILAYLELKAPGFGLPGILAVACFAVMLFGRYLVGLADIPDLLLIAAGVAMLAVEIFVVPGTVWVGLVGGILIIGGFVWSLASAGSGITGPLDQRILLDEALGFVLASLFAMVAVWGLSRILPKTPILNRLTVEPTGGDGAFAGAMPEARDDHARAARPGAKGRALTALRPVGKVVLDADPKLEFEARSEGPTIVAGARVRVVDVQPSGRLVVAAEPPAED